MLHKESVSTRILAHIAANPGCNSKEIRATVGIEPNSDTCLFADLHAAGYYTLKRENRTVGHYITTTGLAVLRDALNRPAPVKKSILKIHGIATPFKQGKEGSLRNAMKFLKAIAESREAADRVAIWKSMPESYNWKLTDRGLNVRFGWLAVKGDYYDGFSNVTLTATGRKVLDYWKSNQHIKEIMSAK